LILITGAAGLIGRHLCSRLQAEGVEFRRFDLRIDPAQDIRKRDAMQRALEGVTGVIHLAAISRVAWSQEDPERCNTTNVAAVSLLVELCLQGAKPWILFASSREVYGNPVRLPVCEDDALLPVNIYGESKRDGEVIINRAREAGLTANICRFSSVYGCPYDHPDRAAMAFAGTAVHGGIMRLSGGGTTFDFTHVLDVVDGIWRLMQQIISRGQMPPIHFASGKGTSLMELAEMAAAYALRPVEIHELPARPFDVSGFVGDSSRAAELLGWTSKISMNDGLRQLVADIARATGQAAALTNRELTAPVVKLSLSPLRPKWVPSA